MEGKRGNDGKKGKNGKFAVLGGGQGTRCSYSTPAYSHTPLRGLAGEGSEDSEISEDSDG